MTEPGDLLHFGTVEGLTCAFVGKCADAMGTSVALTMTRLGGGMIMAARRRSR